MSLILRQMLSANQDTSDENREHTVLVQFTTARYTNSLIVLSPVLDVVVCVFRSGGSLESQIHHVLHACALAHQTIPGSVANDLIQVARVEVDTQISNDRLGTTNVDQSIDVDGPRWRFVLGEGWTCTFGSTMAARTC